MTGASFVFPWHIKTGNEIIMVDFCNMVNAQTVHNLAVF